MLDQLYDPNGSGRFLVADEVGMGKTLVARGVIAGAIERCQRDPRVERIDVLYICSNAEIARQNLKKLTVEGAGSESFDTRITMLAVNAGQLSGAGIEGRKKVNFIAFTPGTSFESGRPGGKVEERALLYVMLEPLYRKPARRRALAKMLRLGVLASTWEYALFRNGDADALRRSEIGKEFRALLGRDEHADLRKELLGLVNRFVAKRGRVAAGVVRESRTVISELRHLLARAGVDHLEPDLVVLDEFQRFKDLLDVAVEDEPEIKTLARQLFEYRDVKVLLLSATPYRGFTFQEEKGLTDDSHHEDFLRTLAFLHRSERAVDGTRQRLADLRSALIGNGDVEAAFAEVRSELLKVMCRTERPLAAGLDMVSDVDRHVPPPEPSDLLGYVALDRIARDCGAQFSIEYWKSVPYFLNFMDGYQVGERVRETPEVVTEHAEMAQLIDTTALRRRMPLDAGNPRLRALQAATVDKGWWKLLWLPPSLPYLEAGGVFGDVAHDQPRKQLMFSSWAAAPSAVASMLSFEAERRMMPRARSSRSRRLQYRIDGGRAASMTTFALFCPLPDLADRCDPFKIAQRHQSGPVARSTLERESVDATRAVLPAPGVARADVSTDSWYWAAPLLVGVNSFVDEVDRLSDLLGIGDDAEDLDANAPSARGLALHIRRTRELLAEGEPLGPHPPDLADWVARLASHSPANVAWRAIGRTTAHIEGITDEHRFDAAAIIADGFRSLFNRPEVMSLLDQLAVAGIGDRDVYWQSILHYCADGDLQAVMDEYLHHKVENENVEGAAGGDDTTSARLLALARGVRDALALRTAELTAFNPLDPDNRMKFSTRFAARYGSARGDAATGESAVARMRALKDAFNSPFWPFVLASTSVGQEGIDFHWWCHSIIHWNLPSNPVDVEQREGRVHRFKGLAVRRNVGRDHRDAALQAGAVDPWRAAFAAAEFTRPEGVYDLWPWWVYDGPTKIERWTPAMALSRDVTRIDEMKRLRSLYRLCFGQPRQEDLVELLRQSGASREVAFDFNLRPPRKPVGADTAI